MVPATTSTNRDILTDISTQGIKTGKKLAQERAVFNRSLDERVSDTISVNVLNKPIPPFSRENWFQNFITELLTDPDRGIIPVSIERQSTPEELKSFHRLREREFAEEISKRVHQTILFVIDPTKMTLRENTRYFLQEGVAMRRGEVLLDDTIPPEAITHVFIPEKLQELAEGLFSHCEVRCIGSKEMDLSLPNASNTRLRDVTVVVPDYEQAITDLAKERFGDLADLNDKRPSLVFHVTRLS